MELELKRRGHTVDVVDPVVENLPLLTRPHFSYPSGESPHDALAERLGGAQAYVMVTPEYNHAPGPALLNLIDHFGSSTFSFKPSLIVSYSQVSSASARLILRIVWCVHTPWHRLRLAGPVGRHARRRRSPPSPVRARLLASLGNDTRSCSPSPSKGRRLLLQGRC